MIDAHCHLNFKAFEKDVDEAIKSAFKAGVKAIINVGAHIDSSQKAIELANTYENLYATVGIHPHHANELEKNWEEKFEQLAKDTKVIAIGECGLDYFSYESNGVVDPKIQKNLFIKQIEIAHKLKIPLMIHNRHAGKDIADILSNYKSLFSNPPGMFHCFSGDLELLKKALNLGFYIGFDGNITYKGKATGETIDLRDLAKACPIDKLIVETDAPYLTPEPYRGQRNKPEYVIIVGKTIAVIKGISFEEVEKQTTKNTNILFQLNAIR